MGGGLNWAAFKGRWMVKIWFLEFTFRALFLVLIFFFMSLLFFILISYFLSERPFSKVSVFEKALYYQRADTLDAMTSTAVKRQTCCLLKYLYLLVLFFSSFTIFLIILFLILALLVAS